jgi:NADPH:quinone reductase
MNAIVIPRPGGPDVLAVEERPRPSPGPGDILVRVHASALNRADILQRRGKYPAPPGAPEDIPGLEYAGEVAEVGPGAGLWAVGNRVMGIVAGGGHAEYVCVNEREAIRIPQALSFEEAAAVPEAFMTAYDALFRILGITVGDRVLIHAVASGVGTAASQLAAAAGATVFGTSRTAAKLDRVRELGVAHPIDSSRDDFTRVIRDETAGEGVRAALDLLGGPELPRTLDVLAVRGRLALVGTLAGQRAEFDLGQIMRRRLEIHGTVLRSRPPEEKIALARELSAHVLPLLSAGRVRPVVDRVMPFGEMADAHRLMEENRTFGKIVLSWDGSGSPGIRAPGSDHSASTGRRED